MLQQRSITKTAFVAVFGSLLSMHGFAKGDGTPVVRAAAPRAAAAPVIDGRLTNEEYASALCTPIEYFHHDAANRAAQFYYQWDDLGFYVGLRTLDEKPFSPESPLWEGDAVEWYFDTRRDANFLSRAWPEGPNSGAVHCFFTAMRTDQLEPRFTLRPGYEQAIARRDVEVGCPPHHHRIGSRIQAAVGELSSVHAARW